jgi:hypothetical protein
MLKINLKHSMKTFVYLFLFFIVISCNSKLKTTESKPLFEILTTQEEGGASIRFFEILSEEKEIKMLQNDDLLKNKINSNDTKTCNFIIMNMGEKTTLGYTITIQKVEETPSKIIITTQDNEPKSKQSEEKEVFYYPYTIVKINSKKEIVIQ